jgi:type II secretory pathway pseudopilin PulG
MHSILHAQVDLTYSSDPSYTSLNNANCIAAYSNFVHVVFTGGKPGNEEVYYIQSFDRGNSWDDPVLISNNLNGAFPSIAVSGNIVHVVFFSPTNAGIFYVRSQDNGISWEDPVLLSSQVEVHSYPSLAVNGSFLHLAWENDWVGNQKILYKRSIDDGSNWSDDVMLSVPGSTPSHPSIAASATHVHLVYQDENGIEYLKSSNDGVDWSMHASLWPEGEQPSITVSDNLVMIVWMSPEFTQIESIRSTDHGDTWENETMPVQNQGEIEDAKIISSGQFLLPDMERAVEQHQ